MTLAALLVSVIASFTDTKAKLVAAEAEVARLTAIVPDPSRSLTVDEALTLIPQLNALV